MIRASDRRVALVTGAGQGIGKAVVEVLAARGYGVAAVDRNPDRLERALAPIDGDVEGVVADVLDEAAIVAMTTQVLERFGRWDVLVNNAAALRFGGVETTTPSDWDAVFAGCVKTAWLCARAAVPQLRESGTGRIINFSSIVAQGGDSHEVLAYTAAKAAIIGFTTAAARELGPSGITVNAISPGAVETEAWQKFPDPAALKVKRSATAVIGRVAQPWEIGEAVAYLASLEAGFVTGQTLVLDGGRIDKI
jgi:3-oxoacyl-[acyl-carrier protein] reductase